MNTNDIREHLLGLSPWVDPKNTVDTVKAGDPTRAVHEIGVGWIASIENLRAAAEIGCDLFVTHEPTFWQHEAPEDRYRNVEPGAAKTAFLQQTGMVVLRCHDAWDRWPGIGITDSWAAWLGLTRLAGRDSGGFCAAYDIEPTILSVWATDVARRVHALGEDSIRITGDSNRPLRRVAIGTGCAVPDKEMIDKGADAVIATYDGASYWSTRQRLSEFGVGVLTVEHGTSEMPGTMNLARYLHKQFNVPAHYLDRQANPRTILGR